MIGLMVWYGSSNQQTFYYEDTEMILEILYIFCATNAQLKKNNPSLSLFIMTRNPHVLYAHLDHLDRLVIH
jgi:hypothetical protein